MGECSAAGCFCVAEYGSVENYRNMVYDGENVFVGGVAMELKNIDVFLERSLNFRVKEINANLKFWMIRTKKGYFYEEFVKNGFIALGWNIITSSTNLSEQAIESVKTTVNDLYGDKVPMMAVNKCKNFIDVIKEGDYILIPSEGSSRIAIAVAGEYYEDESKDYELEISVIPKIENKEYEIHQIECPYRKRRKIEVLKIVDMQSLSYELRMAISSYHGISNFDKYAVSILNVLYDCYSFDGDIHFTINVKKQDAIRPREISRLMYSLTEFFCGIVDEEIVSTTINLNSPGSVRIILKKGVEKLTKAKMPLVFLFIAVIGGKGLGFELPGVMGFIKECKMMEVEVQKEEVAVEKERLELYTAQLEYAEQYMKLMKEAKEEGIDIDSLLEQINELNILGDTLKFDANIDGEIKNEE